MAEPTQDELKGRAAKRALEFVRDGMRLGLGTGSTARHFVAQLGERVRNGLTIVGVPTSEATRVQAEREGIPLTTLDETPELDLVVDGADEFNDRLDLIKGGGGALLREKIVAAAAKSMVVITDQSKQVRQLGRFPLPVEVNPFGLGATTRLMERAAHGLGLGGSMVLRVKPNEATTFVTDGGHFILDCHFGAIPEPSGLADALARIPGVVEHGLFIGLATTIVVAGISEVRLIGAAG